MTKLKKHASPIAVARETPSETYRIREEDSILSVNVHEFESVHHINGIIRILNEEYEQIDQTLPFLTHFNLQFAGNRIGGRNALPRIITQGYYRALGDEVTPVLSFDNVITGICVRMREHVPYKALHNEDFTYSMKHIQNVTDLKKAILRRYRVSMPDLNEEEILNLGVAITTLRFDGMFK